MESSAIHFFKEGVRFRVPHASRLPQWISRVIRKHKKHTGEINYIFCSDRYLLKLNREFLHHETFTDIITFPATEEKNVVSGDIYISVERVRQNAAVFKTTFRNETASCDDTWRSSFNRLRRSFRGRKKENAQPGR
jgi:ssRNA-specific RNase YbeY (16S rRNA maturation enzyme)